MTTLKHCVKAWQALNTLMKNEMDYASAHGLVMLRAALRPHVQFYNEEETSLSDKYAEHDKDGRAVLKGPGVVEFGTAENLAAFLAERAKLDEVTLTEDINLVKIKAPERITPEQVEALSPYVIFEEAGI